MYRLLTVMFSLVAIATSLLPSSAAAECNDGVVKTTKLPNGCTRKVICNGGEWEEMGCSGTLACTGCGGGAGTQACSTDCEVSGCNVGPEVCNNCDDNGDGSVDNAPNSSNIYSLKEACNPNSCSQGGMKTCTATGWSACSGCEGTASCVGCEGRQGTRTCAASCSATPCAVGAEKCNNCDDNGDGWVDNAVGSPQNASYTEACNPNACSQGGKRTCSNGTLSATCTGCGGSAPCSTACGVATSRVCDGQCDVAATCSTAETCNNCDDDRDGTVDEALSCQPCGL